MSFRMNEGLDLGGIRAVVPILVLQDHIFRVPFLNWYLNRQIQDELRQYAIRPGVIIRPLTVVGIHDLESMIHSVEAENFDFIYANRAPKRSLCMTLLLHQSPILESGTA